MHGVKPDHVYPHKVALHAHLGNYIQLSCTSPLDKCLSHDDLWSQRHAAGLTQALEHAIQSVVKSSKQPKFAHPTVRNGRYWRRIKNRTRWYHKQIVYEYVKALCWLHQFLQQNVTKHSDTRARNLRADLRSDDEHCIHKQDKAKDQKSNTVILHDTNKEITKTMQANQTTIADLQPMRANIQTK